MRPPRWFEALTPRQKQVFFVSTAAGICAIVVLGIAAYAWNARRGANEPAGFAQSPSPDAETSPSPTATPVPTVARAIDGLQVPQGSENRRPLAVMIENHPDARPQSGLGHANLVYEAIAEGGITRFMAVFADPSKTVKVGPVRSARTYFLDFATEMNAMYAHVGGNIDALDQIQQQGGVADLDQFAAGAPTYARVPRGGVSTEHTMYSSTDRLWSYAEKRGFSFEGTYRAWKFTEGAAVAERPETQAVTVNFSQPSYKVGWTYDAPSNTYLRSMAGTPHNDAEGNVRISASNIVLQTVAQSYITTRINEQGQRFTLTGTGKGVLIQNGKSRPITWKKAGTDRTLYYLEDGTEATFVQGTTWVELVHKDTPISY